MSKRQILAVLGVWVMIFLFLGFPASWMKPIAIVSGVLIILISYSGTARSGASQSRTSGTFVESSEKVKTNPEQ